MDCIVRYKSKSQAQLTWVPTAFPFQPSAFRSRPPGPSTSMARGEVPSFRRPDVSGQLQDGAVDWSVQSGLVKAPFFRTW